MYSDCFFKINLRALNVLLVEDDLSTLALMEELILNASHFAESSGGGNGPLHRVYKASEAEEGLELVRKVGNIDLIFLDYHLPKMNGNTFCRVIRASDEFFVKPSLWIVAHTREQRVDLIEGILASGANDYLVKPIDPSQFFLAFRVAQYGIARLEHLYRRLDVKQKIIESSIET
jgi:CheY-like chemotaxis protein